MNTVLVVLGFLGVGAILISAYVFTVAARNYVSDSSYASEDESEHEGQQLYIVRSNNDRRSDKAKQVFPMKLPSGQVIKMDRRQEPERRVSNG